MYLVYFSTCFPLFFDSVVSFILKIFHHYLATYNNIVYCTFYILFKHLQILSVVTADLLIILTSDFSQNANRMCRQPLTTCMNLALSALHDSVWNKNVSSILTTFVYVKTSLLFIKCGHIVRQINQCGILHL